MSLIVRSNIKGICKELGINNVSGKVAETLNNKAEQLLKDACERALKNNRKTLMEQDL